MGVNAREARQEARKAEAVKEVEAEKKKAEKEEKKKEKEAEEQRKKELSVQPGVAVGTTEASDEKIVYLTFDDGPSENTQKVLDILDQYDAKATFFIRGRNRSTVR
jgi:Polysaccharide deacetylase